MQKPNRIDLLKRAIEYTDGDRRTDYGSPIENHEHIAMIFNSITGKRLSAKDIALVQVATKLARMTSSSSFFSFLYLLNNDNDLASPVFCFKSLSINNQLNPSWFSYE